MLRVRNVKDRNIDSSSFDKSAILQSGTEFLSRLNPDREMNPTTKEELKKEYPDNE